VTWDLVQCPLTSDSGAEDARICAAERYASRQDDVMRRATIDRSGRRLCPTPHLKL